MHSLEKKREKNRDKNPEAQVRRLSALHKSKLKLAAHIGDRLKINLGRHIYCDVVFLSLETERI